MDPNEITLDELTKQFSYQKISNDIDAIDDISLVRNIAKSYAKLFLKQQEVGSGLGLKGV